METNTVEWGNLPAVSPPSAVGTTVNTLTSKYDELVSRYRRFAKASADNIIKMAEVVYEAEQTLDDDDLKRFCKGVGLEHEGSTFRKLKIIGENASRFESCSDRLPNNWTTLYSLARIKPNEFERVVEDERFGPNITAKDVNEILGKGKKSTPAPKAEVSVAAADKFVLDVAGLDEQAKQALYDRLVDIADEFGVSLEAKK